MNALLVDRLREAVASLSLISHTAAVSYDKIARDTSESIGGKRPAGTDAEYRPRRPKGPRIEGDAQSEKAWDEFEEELAAWEASYHRKTPTYFQRKAVKCRSDRQLELLAVEAEETLAAWRRMPIPAGQPPEFGSPQWKRWVAESPLDGGELSRMFSVTRQYIYLIRKQYRP